MQKQFLSEVRRLSFTANSYFVRSGHPNIFCLITQLVVRTTFSKVAYNSPLIGSCNAVPFVSLQC